MQKPKLADVPELVVCPLCGQRVRPFARGGVSPTDLSGMPFMPSHRLGNVPVRISGTPDEIRELRKRYKLCKGSRKQIVWIADVAVAPGVRPILLTPIVDGRESGGRRWPKNRGRYRSHRVP